MTKNRSGYSDVVMLDQERLGLLYETGLEGGDARDTIVFQVPDPPSQRSGAGRSGRESASTCGSRSAQRDQRR